MNKLKLIIKGFIIGVANIIPGVSGGTLAITLGIYEKLIEILSNFTKNIKENIKFLLPIIIGAGSSLLLCSKLISYSLENHKFITVLFFIGLIVGGIPLLYKKVKKQKFHITNLVTFLVPVIVVLIFTFISDMGNNVSFENMNILSYITLFLVGIVAAATMVIPGISGSFILMLLGYYEPIINVISSLTKFNNLFSNILILIPFGIGVLIGIIGIAKIIEYLLKKYHIKTYYAILGFVCASIFAILKSLIGVDIDLSNIIIGFVLMSIGFIIAYKLGDK